MRHRVNSVIASYLWPADHSTSRRRSSSQSRRSAFINTTLPSSQLYSQFSSIWTAWWIRWWCCRGRWPPWPRRTYIGWSEGGHGMGCAPCLVGVCVVHSKWLPVWHAGFDRWCCCENGWIMYVSLTCWRIVAVMLPDKRIVEERVLYQWDYGRVWCGMVWYGMIWYLQPLFFASERGFWANVLE